MTYVDFVTGPGPQGRRRRAGFRGGFRLGRTEAVVALWEIGRLWVRELELASGRLRDATQHTPVAERQRGVRGGQSGAGNARGGGEGELKRASRQPGGAGDYRGTKSACQIFK